MKVSNIKFVSYLSIISILGFLTILLKNAFEVDIGLWVESGLFLIIGFALFVAGGYHLIFGYFKGGLSTSEINKIVTVVVGIAAMFVGLLTSPLFGLEVGVFGGIKVIIAAIAILSIGLEMILDLKMIK